MKPPVLVDNRGGDVGDSNGDGCDIFDVVKDGEEDDTYLLTKSSICFLIMIILCNAIVFSPGNLLLYSSGIVIKLLSYIPFLFSLSILLSIAFNALMVSSSFVRMSFCLSR